MSFYSDTSTEDMRDELETLGWYHYDLSRHAAEALLLSNGTDGSYLLRNSNEGPGCFALSVRAKDSVKHFHVTRKENGYMFGFNEFATLQDFVSHFANQPLLGSDTGTLIVLKCPYPWRVEEPSIYESVRVHTAIQTGRTENDLVANAPSLGTKEGYLVKQGAFVKNWKQRWFTLNRYELKYFRDKMCEEPIRTLDLRACSAVQFDYSRDRVNCFCLVFPDRTFYLCAKTGVEADEWIKILRWKLILTFMGVVEKHSMKYRKSPTVEGGQAVTAKKRSITAVIGDTGDGLKPYFIKDIISAGWTMKNTIS